LKEVEEGMQALEAMRYARFRCSVFRVQERAPFGRGERAKE
jgi:hypothetical protein